VFLRKDEYIVPSVSKLVSKRTYRPDDPADDWKIGVREIGDVHGYSF